MEPTFGGINLEDIKAPECFYIEAKIKERLKIPVFHDDQHGTAIIAAAAILNALEIVRKKIGDIKVVCSGAGAAAVACLNLLLALGIDKKNVVVCDSQGVIYEGRNKTLPPTKQKYAIKDDGRRTLGEVMEGSDLFLGLSGPDVLEAEMVKSMARDPIIMALANPEPEIWPPLAKAVRPDAIICTGRSDFPNQVNNVLCFPFIFRGALDVGATAINEEMKIASVHAIAKLAKAEASDLVKNAVGKDIAFGPEHVIPSPFDPRLIVDIASAVAKAAMDSGVATRPLEDLESYQAALTQYVYKTNLFMRPIFAKAKKDIKRVVLCNGEEERVLQATYSVVASGICKPILVGRREVIKARLQELRINLKIDEDFEIFNSDKDPRYDEYCETYYQLCKRRGITRQGARQRLVHAPTRVGALMLYRGEADALVCGTVGAFKEHFAILEEIIGYDNPEKIACAMNALMLSKGNVFITDTHVNEDPDALQIARITEMSARQMRSFGVKPKAALLSNSNYGSIPSAVSDKMKEALAIVHAEDPDLEVDGEMQGDVALVQDMRLDLMDDSPLQEGGANLLVMPNIYAANISHNLLRVSASDGVAIGPILMGMAKPCHILTPISSTRRIVNLCAIAAVDAQRYSHREKQGKL